MEAVRELDEEKVNELVEHQIKQGISPLQIIAECNEGMTAVGDLFSQNIYFISQLMYSAEIIEGVMDRLKPLIQNLNQAGSKNCRVVIGTVQGDIHDIGKNIVVSLLNSQGFEVVDLGVDVPAMKFAEVVRETGAKILGLSALLNFTYPEMKNVVDVITEQGLRDQLTIIIGGAPVDEQVLTYTGADYFVTDAVTGVNICKKVSAL